MKLDGKTEEAILRYIRAERWCGIVFGFLAGVGLTLVAFGDAHNYMALFFLGAAAVFAFWRAYTR